MNHGGTFMMMLRIYSIPLFGKRLKCIVEECQAKKIKPKGKKQEKDHYKDEMNVANANGQ